MRRMQQTEILQVGHHVADRGRAEVETKIPSQCARTHRLTILDKVLHQGLEQEQAAFGE
ncbi:hypothetical protein D3C83_261520 [compost metagenome]